MKRRLSLLAVAVGSSVGGRTIREKKDREKKRGAGRISEQTPKCSALKIKWENLQENSL